MLGKKDFVTLVFAALADRTRRQIVERLSTRGEAQVTELARPFRISMPAISRHLRVLENARLIQRRRIGRLHLIRTRTGGLKQIHQWIARYAAGWDSSFDTLDKLLREEQEKERRSGSSRS